MEMKHPYKRLSRRQEKNLLQAADAVVRTEFEIPDRTGCLGQQTLRSLARRDPLCPDTPDLIDHIGTCSYCFVEYSQFRNAYKRDARLRYILAAAATVAVLSLISVLWLRAPLEHWIHPEERLVFAPRPQRLTEVILDLRMMGPVRGAGTDAQTQGPTPRLPRARLSIKIQLPIGSEDGTYDVAIANLAGQLLQESAGEASVQNFIEVLPIKMNLSDFPPGPYELRLRRAHTEWASYHVVLE
jgi:hypothetical protein